MKRATFLLVVILLSVTTFAQTKKPKAAATSPTTANVYPIQEGYVDANGVLIYYQTIGHGAPLMIVHGGPGVSHDYLMPHLLPLARGNKLIFIDERGSGRSENWKTRRSTPWKTWWRTWRASARRCIWARSA